MSRRIVTHQAINPRNGSVIFRVTMSSRDFWGPWLDPISSLYDYVDELIFQTCSDGVIYTPSIVVVHNGQILITTNDAYERIADDDSTGNR